MGNRYSDMLSGVVKLTREQRDAVNKVLIRHIGELIWDIPAVDEALYQVEKDLDLMTTSKESPNADPS